MSVTPGARVSAFTRDFIDELLNSGSGSGSGSGSDANQQLLGLQASGLGTSGDEEQMSEQDALLAELMANAESSIDTNTETMSPNVQFILSASRFVAGSVEKPGYYPVANTVSLAQLLSAAGGLTENADIERLEIIYQKILDGKIVADKVARVDLTKTEARSIRLSDQFKHQRPSPH